MLQNNFASKFHLNTAINALFYFASIHYWGTNGNRSKSNIVSKWLAFLTEFVKGSIPFKINKLLLIKNLINYIYKLIINLVYILNTQFVKMAKLLHMYSDRKLCFTAKCYIYTLFADEHFKLLYFETNSSNKFSNLVLKLITS